MCLLRLPEAFLGRTMNIHPALIPAFCGKGYYGHHVHEAVLAYGAKVSGCTVHFVDNVYDHGPVIVQKAVAVAEGDTPDTRGRGRHARHPPGPGVREGVRGLSRGHSPLRRGPPADRGTPRSSPPRAEGVEAKVKRQRAKVKRQKSKGKSQKAKGKRQKAKGKRQEWKGKGQKSKGEVLGLGDCNPEPGT